VCADNNAGSSSNSRRRVEATFTNHAAAGTALTVLKWGTSTTPLCTQ
jgi:hypothetical protein